MGGFLLTGRAGGVRYAQKKDLLVKKSGEPLLIERELSGLSGEYGDAYAFSNIGDTVIVATDANGDVRIVNNLTMRNKIKAFTRQK
ncbi:hypothetical protein HDR66_01815 [bacterium]|nr:hypothetical protein [bacterium]